MEKQIIVPSTVTKINHETFVLADHRKNAIWPIEDWAGYS